MKSNKERIHIVAMRMRFKLADKKDSNVFNSKCLIYLNQIDHGRKKVIKVE